MNEVSPLICNSSLPSKQLWRNPSWKTNQKRRLPRKFYGKGTRSTMQTQSKLKLKSKSPLEPVILDTMASESTVPYRFAGEVIEHHHERNNSNSLEFSNNGVGPGDDGRDDITEQRPTSEHGAATRREEQSIEGRFASSSSSISSPEKLGVVSMAVLVFYNVSGGPFGIEATVRAGGNMYAILGFLIMPFVWSLQEALMTAELGTAFPEASGGVVWVEEAFGPLAGWMAGYLGWIAGATDNAIYPVLFLEYLLQVIGNKNDSDGDGDDDSEIITPVVRFCLLTSTSILLAYVNWRGLALVGKMSVLICVAAMSPFVILVVVGSFKVDPSRWFTLPNADIETAATALGGGILWRPFLNNLFWNLNSFDSAGCLVAELDSTASFIRAMMLGVILVVSCYFFPLLVAIGSSDSEQSDWTDGYLVAINTEVVGPWLGAWTVFAAGISNIGLFQAELSADAFQLMGMADRGYLPKIFRQRSKHGTPTYGLILGTAVIVAMGVSDLDRLIEMLNFNYGFSLLMEIAAFFKLRVSRPNLERPYRIPLNTLGCAFVFFPTVVATMLVMSLATNGTYYFALTSWITGYLLYVARRWNEQQGRVLDPVADYGRVEDESFEDDSIENAIEVGAISGDYS